MNSESLWPPDDPPGQGLGLMRLRDPEPGAASDGDRKPVAVVQRGGPDISAQVPFYPVTNDAFGTASYDQFHDGYFLSRDGMRWFWDQYTTD